MKIAIHEKKNDFSSKWITYCKENNIDHKIVDCYSSDIIKVLEDCDALLWHFHQANPKDFLFAKQLIFSLSQKKFPVFPDFYTAWHFDDKVGQKYLLEAAGIPLVPTHVFYDKDTALEWVESTTFPKVFKLRGGAGSSNVKKVKTKKDGRKFVHRAFGRGFSNYDKMGSIKERWYKLRKGNGSLLGVIKGVLRLGITTEFAKIAGRERGYIYFQEFIPDNDFDIRVVVIDGKAFAMKRMVRQGDFRASGSGLIKYKKTHFEDRTIELSFKVKEKLNSQCVAIDFVYQNGEPLVVEVSYGFMEGYYNCKGYWDRELNWHPGPFDAPAWMVETVIRQVKQQQLSGIEITEKEKKGKLSLN